jgi:putative PIN family toxin of toxin-antitoxin system
MRVVLDTNIFISAVLGGKLRIIVDMWRQGKFTLIVSEAIAHEYLDVIQRPKFKIPALEIASVTDYLFKAAEFVTPTEKLTVIEADLTDNKFLEAAIAGQAEFIVSGDRHVFEIKIFRKIPIITASEFIAWLESAQI